MAAQDAEHGIDASRARNREHAADPSTTSWLDIRPLIAVVGLAAFAVLTWIVGSGVVIPFDQPLLDAGHGLGQYMQAWRGLSESANLPLIVVGVAIVLWLLYKRQRSEAGLVIVVLAVITAGSELIKQLIARPRPPGYDSSVLGVVYSYPSGHILEAITIYGIIAVLVWRSGLPKAVRLVVPVIFTGIIVLVAIARVATGDHYPSDVLAGILAGVSFVALFSWLTDLMARHRAAKRT